MFELLRSAGRPAPMETPMPGSRETLEPIRTPLEQRLHDFPSRGLPVIVWGLAIVATLLLMIHREARRTHPAIAAARTSEILSIGQGRLDAVDGELDQRVRRGDFGAGPGDAHVRSLLAIAEATIDKLESDLETARAGHRHAVAELARDRVRFLVDDEDPRLQVPELRIEVETARVDLQRQILAIGCIEEQASGRLNDPAELVEARRGYEESRRRLEETERLLARAEEELRSFEADEPVLTLLHSAIDVELRRLDEIRRTWDALVVRSPAGGQLNLLACTEGRLHRPER
jgi:multidrug resistance efflux pump